MAEGKCYLQVRLDTFSSGRTKLVVMDSTQSPPSSLKPGVERVIELHLTIPDYEIRPLAVSAKSPAHQMAEDYVAIVKQLEGTPDGN